MRRITLLAVVVFALVGVMAFADDMAAPALTWSGSLFSGVQFDNSTTAGTTTAKLWDVDNGHPADFWIDGALSGKLAGLKFELDTTDGATVATDVLYGWWKPIDMLTVTGGIGYGDIYTTPIEGWGHGAPGIQVALSPIDGLNVGGSYIANTTAAAVGADVVVAGSYAAPNLVTVGGGYDVGGDYAWAGVNVTAVKGLTAEVDFEDTTSAGGNMRVEGNVGYAVGSLSPAVWVYYQSVGTAWGVKPNVSYAMGSVTPAAYFQYNADGSMALGANAAIAAEKQTVYVYGDFNLPANTWDFGVNFRMAF